MISHKRLDPEKFSSPVFSLQLPLPKDQSLQCVSLQCSMRVGEEMGPSYMLVPPGHSYSPEVTPLQSLREKKTAQHF